MNKEEFLKKMKALREQKLQFEKEYIDSNIKYPAGTKLKITGENGKVRFGLVKFSVVEYDDVVPYVNLIMKDGNESQRRVHIDELDTVEVVD